jgi:hypothetical protein
MAFFDGQRGRILKSFEKTSDGLGDMLKGDFADTYVEKIVPLSKQTKNIINKISQMHKVGTQFSICWKLNFKELLQI